MTPPDELPWTGERLVPSQHGDIVLEHLHRYAFALELATGKDVIDIACGEGYGSHLLAGRARNVIGVDISEEAVRHAAAKYQRPNLAFRAGSCTAIPLPDRSADLVVSFETIEHFAEHERFLAEVRRVLRPGGLFVVSTPDKAIYTDKLGARNQFHPRELSAAEFQKILHAHFPHTRLLSQRVSLGSFLAPLDHAGDAHVGTHRGDFSAIEFTPGAAEGVYLLGVGSDAPLPPLKLGLFEFGGVEGGAFITPLARERWESHEQDREILDSLLRWQKRSWFKRAFHRWRPPGTYQEKLGLLRRLERSIRKRRKKWFAKLSNPSAPAEKFISQTEKPSASAPASAASPLSAPRPRAAANGRRHVVFLSGESDTPGHLYRVEMLAAALAQRGYETRIVRTADLSGPPPLTGVAALVIWRVGWSPIINEIIIAARQARAKVVFDVDDLMFDPALARSEIVDGIRSQNVEAATVARIYSRMQQTLAAADACTATTAPLAAAMRGVNPTAFVLPNGFDEPRLRLSRAAAAEQRRSRDGLIRLGYAGGTLTHQKDFCQAAPALARILQEHPDCRLVLFRQQTPAGTSPCLDPEEFPGLKKLAGQIEWRPFVPVHDLPREIARFDINLAPLETGNPFCEAKSELKYFEAALVDVPTVASPTAPYADAIRHQQTGFLARTDDDWYAALKTLVTDPALRRRLGLTAALDVLWRFGPERRAELAGAIYEQIIDGDSPAAARECELELRRAAIPRPALPECSEYDVVFEAGSAGQSEVAVVVTLHNYDHYIVETLESVHAQTLLRKELIVVEGCSTDDSLRIAQEWLQANAAAFTHVALLKNRRNFGPSRTRNTGFAFADTPYIFSLDADNILLPGCLEACWQALARTDAAFAYPTVQEFGKGTARRSDGPWSPARLAGGNYIDAMALIRRSAWVAVGGYQTMEDLGWEDYEFWCRFAETGFRGVWLPEILAQYRVHPESLLHTITHQPANRQRVSELLRRLHPWVDV